MKIKLCVLFLSFFLSACAPSYTSTSVPQDRCSKYARTAVEQHEENIRRNCGFDDPRWHTDYDAHYNWCREVPPEVSVAENRDRQNLLNNCGTDKTGFCTQYAKTAVGQHEENIRQNCGFKDPRWHSDYDAHFNFCMEVPLDASEAENRDRQTLFDTCTQGKDEAATSASFPVIPENKKIRLAVIQFKTLKNASQSNVLGTMVSEIFTTEAVNSNAFKIVEREQLNKVLKEFEISQSGIVDTSQAREIGKMLGADAIITGSVMKIGSSIRIDARIIEIETGVIISAESRTCLEELKEISRNINRITKALTEKYYQKTKNQ